jgi:hypothetical protein
MTAGGRSGGGRAGSSCAFWESARRTRVWKGSAKRHALAAGRGGWSVVLRSAERLALGPLGGPGRRSWAVDRGGGLRRVVPVERGGGLRQLGGAVDQGGGSGRRLGIDPAARSANRGWGVGSRGEPATPRRPEPRAGVEGDWLRATGPNYQCALRGSAGCSDQTPITYARHPRQRHGWAGRRIGAVEPGG